jgi:choline dehydrogenase-like flavoprotein
MATGRVQLLSNHLVERLELTSSGSKATGVVAVNQANGDRHLIPGDLVVLAASTIQSVSILLRSSEQVQRGGVVDPSGRLGHD